MEEMTEIFKALSDTSRLRILNLLDKGELCVCDIMNVLEMPQSTVSRHLAVLKSSKFITSRKEGLWHYYKINGNTETGNDFLKILRREWPEDPVSVSDLKKLNSSPNCKPDACCN